MKLHLVLVVALTVVSPIEGGYLRSRLLRLLGSNDSSGDDDNCTDDGPIVDDDKTNPPASTKAPSNCGGGGGGRCFSGNVPVRVLGKGDVLMKDLQVGDQIQVLGKWDSVHYEKVYAFSHREEEEEATFVQITTESGHATTPLEMTPDHMIFVDKLGAATTTTPIPIPAGELKAGDRLIQGHGAQPSTVLQVQPIRRKGFYAPLTQSGHFLANGVVVSAYVAFPYHHPLWKALFQKGSVLGISQHTFTHFVLTPFRMICGSTESSICSVQDTSMPWLMEASIQAVEGMLAFPQWMQWVLFAVLLVGVSCLWVLEMVWTCGWISITVGSPILLAYSYYYYYAKPSLAKVKTV